MPIFATAGTKLYIGGPLDGDDFEVNAASFSGQSALWKEIQPLESLGSIGDVSEEVTFDIIGRARTVKVKGQRNAGTMECVAGLDYADPGQLAVLAAEALPNNFAFKIVLNDAPVGGTPSQRLFVALVMSVREVFDTASSVMKLNMAFSVNSNLVYVAAAAGD